MEFSLLLSPLLSIPGVLLGLWLAQFKGVDRVQRWMESLKLSAVSQVHEVQPACGRPDMKIRFITYDPVMIYIENFLTTEEVTHLKILGEPRYNSSTVFKNGTTRVDIEHRISSSAILPDKDSTVQCIKKRAAELQGFAPVSDIEVLQTVRYTTNQTFRGHFDWFAAHQNPETGEVEYGKKPRNRLTTFFAILEANCTGGATDFPYVPSWNWTERPQWCDYVVCDDFSGVMVKPRVGSAIFWVNLNRDGEGHLDTMHSGHKVLEGTKIGLNIWTRGTAPGKKEREQDEVKD